MLTSDQIPVGLDEIIALYGPVEDAPGNLTTIVFPYPLKYGDATVVHGTCHKLAADNFIQAFKNVQDAGLADQFTEYNGIYAARSIRGQSAHPSLHSWGVAIDMGASTHPMGKPGTWPDGILDAFNAAGFFWGGNFKSRVDVMHWQLAKGY